MKNTFLIIIILVCITVVSAGIGFFVGRGIFDIGGIKNLWKKEIVAEEGRKVLFYRHPMNPSITSPTQQKDEMGMDYIPVYDEEEKPVKLVPEVFNRGKERKVLFYRHPMNPQVTSPTPQKDEMGMDYIPVYEEDTEEEEAPGTVRISPEKIQKIGVRTEEIKRRNLKRIIRTIGRIDHDESRVFDINTKIGGWVEKLYITKTDQLVHPNDKLLEIYSPELVAAQEEYLIALKGRGMFKNTPYEEIKGNAESLIEAVRKRLKYLDISDDQIKNLEENVRVTRTMSIYANNHGIVTDKRVIEGMRVEAGALLFKIIDHSALWVYGEVYEYDLPFIKLGQKAKITPVYENGEVHTATLEHIYTHLGSVRHELEMGMGEARTIKIRFEVPNLEHKLKLGQYVNIELSVDIADNAVSVPDSALIDTGVRQVVIIDRGEGRFEPREVKVGGQADGYHHIISGVKAGEKVVTSANFLIDSESSFRAALQGMKGD